VDKDDEKRKIRYLMDASLIGVLLGRMKEKAVEFLEGTVTLDLALYELGNFIWKECVLKRIISRKEALERIEDLVKILGLMDLEKLEKEDVGSTMILAVDLDLTFYDASYLYIAKSRNMILITEDKELLEKAKRIGVKAVRVEEYLKT
jgi:predicted nucleic acid-binding protein